MGEKNALSFFLHKIQYSNIEVLSKISNSCTDRLKPNLHGKICCVQFVVYNKF